MITPTEFLIECDNGTACVAPIHSPGRPYGDFPMVITMETCQLDRVITSIRESGWHHQDGMSYCPYCAASA